MADLEVQVEAGADSASEGFGVEENIGRTEGKLAAAYGSELVKSSK